MTYRYISASAANTITITAQKAIKAPRAHSSLPTQMKAALDQLDRVSQSAAVIKAIFLVC